MFVPLNKASSGLRRRCGWLAPLLLLILLFAALLQTPVARSEERRFELTLINGEPPGGAPTFQVAENDEVYLSVTSDGPGELHLHGYDLKLPLEPGGSADMRFPANLTGRYPAALHQDSHGGAHGSGALFYLEVYPK